MSTCIKHREERYFHGGVEFFRCIDCGIQLYALSHPSICDYCGLIYEGSDGQSHRCLRTFGHEGSHTPTPHLPTYSDSQAPLQALRYHVSGAIERGESEAITEQR